MGQYSVKTSYIKASSRKDRRKNAGGATSASTVSVSSLSGDYASQSWSRNNFVDFLSAQSVPGVKDFTNGVKVGGCEIKRLDNGALFIDGDLVVSGSVAMYGDVGTTVPSIFDALPIDWKTIGRNANGELYVIGGTGGGIDESQLEAYLTGNNYAQKADISSALTDYETSANIKSWVEAKGYITGITSSMVTTALGYTPYDSADFTKSNIKSTLGISDWALAATKPTYTASEVGALALTGGTINGSITATSFIGNLSGSADYLSGVGIDSFMTFRNIGSYVTADFRKSAFSQSAVDGYIEFWDSYGWYNSQWGSVMAHYGFIGDLTGNADSATKLATPRTIWGQSFDGTANLTGDATFDGKVIIGDIPIYKSQDGVVKMESSLLTTGGVTMYSQASLKNVIDEEGLSLEELATIKPTRFTWKDGRDNLIHAGGIADDVMKVLPEVVKPINDVLTMDYASAGFFIGASLIKPVINHEERIKVLERENKALKEEITKLKQSA